MGAESRQLLKLSDAELLRQCAVDCYRASGPGGQKRNKTSSAVRIRHLATGYAGSSEEDRSQHVNKPRALRRLRKTIALQLREPLDLATYELTEELQSCVSKGGRLSLGRRDVRYPLVISELLDLTASLEVKISEVAKFLGISTGNLVKFFEADSKLWEKVNQMRAAAGLGRLR